MAKVLVKDLRYSTKYVVLRVVSGALKVAVHFWELWQFKASFKIIPNNEGKNEFAGLKLKGWGRFLKSIVFDKIYLPGTWGLFLVHPEKLI